MSIEVLDGINWPDVVSQIEALPRGEARSVAFIGTGKTLLVEHHEDGLVRLRISYDGDGVAPWIYPPNLQTLADILRHGFEQRVQA
jgi:hypothetical protein